MDWLWPIIMLIGLFILRFGVPLLVIVLVVYGLRRLDDRWQAEARANYATALAKQQAEQSPRIELLKVIETPCWVLNNCAEEQRQRCPAALSPAVPCWMARYRAQGKLPPQCYHCQLFAPRRKAPEKILAG